MKDAIKKAVRAEYAKNEGGGVQCQVPEPVVEKFVLRVFERLKRVGASDEEA